MKIGIIGAGTVAPHNDNGRLTSRGSSQRAVPALREERGGGSLADALRHAGFAEKTEVAIGNPPTNRSRSWRLAPDQDS
jgi:hypothetical protein